METTRKARRLLERMAAIRAMERGTVCRMKGRGQFNHQTWQAGRNVVRYVRPEDLPDLRRAIDGYRRFLELTQQYADEIIHCSRRDRERNKKKRKAKPASRKPSDKTRV